MAFYKLYKERAEDPQRYVPTWEFVGEMNIIELGSRWVLMSYKCPTRLTDIFQENPDLLERKMITGKSGAKYYGYRFALNATKNFIRDEKLLQFYNKIHRV